MDPWKPIRLWLCIAAIVAFLAVGTYARLRWGVPTDVEITLNPEAPPLFRVVEHPRLYNPFERLRSEYRVATKFLNAVRDSRQARKNIAAREAAERQQATH
jgi:hypothetical protein